MRSLCAVCAILGLGVVDIALGSDDLHSWSLDDGTEIHLIEDYRAPLVSIRINFPVNTLMPWVIQNDAETAFVGQLLEPEQRLRRKAENLGVSLYLSMGFGFASIGGSSLEADFEALVSLLRETLNNREYDGDELRERHRNRILGWEATSKNPRTTLYKSALEGLYPVPDDPRHSFYSKPGNITTDSRKLSDIRDRIISVPGRVIAVAGHIDRKTVEELISDLLPEASTEGIPSEPFPAATSFSPGTVFTITMDQLTQVYLGLVRDGVTINSEDYPKVRIANHILGGTFSSRLYEKLRHESGDTYSANLNQVFGLHEPGMLLLNTYTRADNEGVAVEKLRSVLSEISKNGVTQDEVDAALAYLNGRLLFASETPLDIAVSWATYRVYGLPGNFQELMLEKASKLTLDEINSFISDFYNPDRFALVRVVPELN